MKQTDLVPVKEGDLAKLAVKGGVAVGLAVVTIWILGWWLTLAGAAVGAGIWWKRKHG